MKELTINLFTKREAELYCRRMYPATKIVPVTLCEAGIITTHYMVFRQGADNSWTPVRNVKPEWVEETDWTRE